MNSVITENTFEEHCASMIELLFCGKRHKLISNLFKQKQQKCIDSSGRNVQIFQVEVKLDPGAEKKSSGNFFCLLALLSYMSALPGSGIYVVVTNRASSV